MKSQIMQNRLSQAFFEFWEARNQRERMILAVGGIALLLALVYLLLIEPALTGRDKLRSSLPQLRQQVAEIQALAKEASSLPQPTARAVAPLSRESLETTLASRGLKPQNLTVSGDVVRVQLTGVSFAGLFDWLANMQQTASLTVTEANIVALAQPDTVDATLTLRQQKSE